jgi:glycine/D-amino acid oxidase-like deaminating enzyme
MSTATQDSLSYQLSSSARVTVAAKQHIVTLSLHTNMSDMRARKHSSTAHADSAVNATAAWSNKLLRPDLNSNAAAIVTPIVDCGRFQGDCARLVCLHKGPASTPPRGG